MNDKPKFQTDSDESVAPTFSRPAPVIQAAGQPVCPGCKAEVASNWKICPECGERLVAIAAEPAATPTDTAAKTIEVKERPSFGAVPLEVGIDPKASSAKSISPANKGGMGFMGKVKLAGIAAVVLGGVFMWPSQKKAPAPVAAPVVAAATPSASGAPATPPAAQPGVAVVDPAAAPAGPLSMDAILKATVTPEDRALQQRQARDLYTAWPADKRTCQELTNIQDHGVEFYTRLCAEKGAALYFKCSPTGVIWNATLPGCEIQ